MCVCVGGGWVVGIGVKALRGSGREDILRTLNELKVKNKGLSFASTFV